MPLQVDVTTQNAQLESIETQGGVTPFLRFYSGAKPTNCAAAATGTLIAEMVLPSDWMAAAASGSKTLLGVWQDLLANATGVIGYFRGVKVDGTTCFMQGAVTESPDVTGEIVLDNKTVNINQKIVINTFTLTSANG